MNRLASALIGICLVFSTSGGCASSLRDSRNSFRVMSYNVHHGAAPDGSIDIGRIAAVIRNANPDIVALQEVDRGVERSGKIDMMTRLSDLTGMTYAFGKTIDFQGGEYGNGFLVRYPILEERFIHFTARGGEPRGYLSLVLEIQGTQIAVINTHLDSGAQGSIREAQALELRQGYGILGPVPLILLGDLNDTPGSTTVRMFQQSLKDTWGEPDATGYTFPSDNPDRRIDYIFVSRETAGRTSLRIISSRVLPANASDHLPIVADLELVPD